MQPTLLSVLAEFQQWALAAPVTFSHLAEKGDMYVVICTRRISAVPHAFAWHDFLFLSLKSPFMAAMQ